MSVASEIVRLREQLSAVSVQMSHAAEASADIRGDVRLVASRVEALTLALAGTKSDRDELEATLKKHAGQLSELVEHVTIVRRVVYGAVALILAGVVVALLALVVPGSAGRVESSGFMGGVHGDR